jgi:hypothetical protein
MRRRDFLRAGSAGLVGAGATTSASALAGPEGRTTVDAPVAEAFSVGYWIGSDRRPAFGRLALASAGSTDDRVLFEPDVGPASRPAAGVPPIPGVAVRLGVHGLVEAERRIFQRPLAGLSLLVDFVVPDVGTIQHVAWRYSRHPVRNLSRAVRLAVPVGPVGDLGLRLEGRRGQAPTVARLSLLRRGVYFLALPGPGGNRIDWSRLQFREDAGSDARRLVQRGLFGLEPARFDYFVVSVDTVGAPGSREA